MSVSAVGWGVGPDTYSPDVETSPVLLGRWADETTLNHKSTAQTFDMHPGMKIEPDRSWWIDCGIVLKGSVILESDDGERRLLKEGDVVVQRSRMLSLRNESEERARVHFVPLGEEMDGEYSSRGTRRGASARALPGTG